MEQENLKKKPEEVGTVGIIFGFIILIVLIFLAIKVLMFVWGSVSNALSHEPENNSEVVTETIPEQVQENKSTETVQKVEREEYSDYEAYYEAQKILEKFLKAPSTAKYPSSSEVTIKRFKDDTFQVFGYVDSQNGFGAMIRSDWTVALQFVGENVKPLLVIVDGELMYKADSAE
jgi:hypothetical protein